MAAATGWVSPQEARNGRCLRSYWPQADFRNVLVAACWSSAAPPTAYPLNLPAALLINGASTVVGGLWPLPAADTAAVVAAVTRKVAGGAGLRHAIYQARAQASEAGMSRWGLAVHGGPASP